MQKIKEYVQKYKVPLIVGTFLVLLGVHILWERIMLQRSMKNSSQL
ncbi:MAG: hypothetical protein WCS30_04465 [Selenomonadaceae bacterium]